MNIVEIALSYAKEKHKGQKYGEEDYFEGHICKVYEIVKQVGGSETEQVVAILHDVFEDCEVDENDVINVFGEEVYKSCMALTRRKGERYGDYLKRVAEDDVATFVKMADIPVNFESALVQARWRGQTNIAQRGCSFVFTNHSQLRNNNADSSNCCLCNGGCNLHHSPSSNKD